MSYLETVYKIKDILIRNKMPRSMAYDVATDIYDAATAKKMGCTIKSATEGLADKDAPKGSWQFCLHQAWENIRLSKIDLQRLEELRTY